MGQEQINIILNRLENLERQNEKLFEFLTGIVERLESMSEITIKNGGGRLVTYKSGEFFQMLYDRNKETFNNVSDISKRLGHFVDIAFKFSVAGYVIFRALKGLV